jgi:hypothetical protein
MQSAAAAARRSQREWDLGGSPVSHVSRRFVGRDATWRVAGNSLVRLVERGPRRIPYACGLYRRLVVARFRPTQKLKIAGERSASRQDLRTFTPSRHKLRNVHSLRINMRGVVGGELRSGVGTVVQTTSSSGATWFAENRRAHVMRERLWSRGTSRRHYADPPQRDHAFAVRSPIVVY